MKTFKAIFSVTVLALSLSIPAYADNTPGDVHDPGKAIAVPGPNAQNDNPDPNKLTPAADGDIVPSVFADLLWTLATMF
jgi:hypothetical protein